MANVIFKVGTKALFDALEQKDTNTLYWLEDVQELYKGNLLFATGKTAAEIVKQRNLAQNSDTSELEEFCRKAIEANPKAVAEFKAGNEKAINALIGPVMKASKGKANPAVLLPILKSLIK